MSFLNRFPGFLFSIIVCKRGGQEFRLTQDTCCLFVRNARMLALMDDGSKPCQTSRIRRFDCEKDSLRQTR